MDILTQHQLIETIEGFCRRHEMSESRLGRDALNNPAFVGGLRDGKSPTLETLNKLQAFMKDRDAAAALKAKLTAPPPEPVDEQENLLPFAQAPVKPTGACSPTSSSTGAPRSAPAASASSRCSGSDVLRTDPEQSSAEEPAK